MFMIAYLTGKLVQLEPNKAIIESNGLGYEVLISLNTYKSIKNSLNQSIKLNTLFVPKEDRHYLVGFYEDKEKDIYIKLLKVPGVGLQTALRILSGISPGEFVNAIEKNDVQTITKIKGVGKKTAQKIIIELKGILPQDETELLTDESNIYEDVKNALIVLGFTKEEAQKKVAVIRKKFPGVDNEEELIALALKN